MTATPIDDGADLPAGYLVAYIPAGQTGRAYFVAAHPTRDRANAEKRFQQAQRGGRAEVIVFPSHRPPPGVAVVF